MPKAEAGSLKAISNQLKSKGLTRLRWYCQVCGKANRDENAMKQHTMSPSHVRNMQVVGENSVSFINQFSNEFERTFLQHLRTAHGTKPVGLNKVYNEFIADKNHTHMNSTKWNSLTEFAGHLGRDSKCRVVEGERGLEIAWIDSSPDALRRQEALRKKERQDRGDEEREQRLIAEQVERARRDAEDRGEQSQVENEEDKALNREEGQRIALTFGKKKEEEKDKKLPFADVSEQDGFALGDIPPTCNPPSTTPVEKVSMNIGSSNNKPKNVFAMAGKKSTTMKPVTQQRQMSEAERIMKEELERKRSREPNGGPPGKRRKV